MGQPGVVKPHHHLTMRQTRGTETSKYLQEKKTSSDSLSSGERTGKSPNQRGYGLAGVVGPFFRNYLKLKGMGSPARAGDSPVSVKGRDVRVS